MASVINRYEDRMGEGLKIDDDFIYPEGSLRNFDKVTHLNKLVCVFGEKL